MSKKKRMSGYAGEAYQILFTEAVGELQIEDLHASRAKLLGYRTKTTRSGNVLEFEAYPIWAVKAEASAAKRAALEEKHREAVRKVNKRNATRTLTRLANENFTAKDLFLTLTYAGDAPSLDQARKDITNFFRRVRTWMQAHAVAEPLKYLYVIEHEDDPERGKHRVHHHVIMTGIDRDAVETIWQCGRANARRLQPDDHGLEGLARYMTKDPKGKKRWGYSQNLKTPQPEYHNKKLSRRKAEQLAMGFDEVSRKVLERAHPGYRFVDCVVKTSKYVSGAYIYARMVRDDPTSKGGCRHRGGGGGRTLTASTSQQAAGSTAQRPWRVI